MGVNPFEIEGNVKGGIKYLGFLLKKFDSLQLAVAAYNAGPASVQKYGGTPPFEETQKFVRRVLKYYKGRV